MPTKRVSASIRRLVSARARNYCEYCRSSGQFATESFNVEHINPRDRGGATTLDNLAWTCFGCNSHKHTKINGIDPETGERVPLFHPRQDVWSDHFTWNEDFTQVIGRTACGRATVVTLKLNRPGVSNLRRVLVAAGEHPPLE
jgi:hypothetical protein